MHEQKLTGAESGNDVGIQSIVEIHLTRNCNKFETCCCGIGIIRSAVGSCIRPSVGEDTRGGEDNEEEDGSREKVLKLMR